MSDIFGYFVTYDLTNSADRDTERTAIDNYLINNFEGENVAKSCWLVLSTIGNARKLEADIEANSGASWEFPDRLIVIGVLHRSDVGAFHRYEDELYDWLSGKKINVTNWLN